MRLFRTIILGVIALLCIVASVLLSIDGNLSRVIGHSAFGKGERLFPYSKEEMDRINWMRIGTLHDTAEFKRLDNGIWWMTSPWNDRMDPRAAAAILQYTYSTDIVDALPMNNTVRRSIREFGVETSPVAITLKKTSDSNNDSTLARYTLGSTAPWIVEDIENKEKNATTYMKTDFYGKNKNILVSTGNILPLFKEGIRQLRDHHPLLIPPLPIPSPAQPQEIRIKSKHQDLLIRRQDMSSPWMIISPIELPTDSHSIQNLLVGLQQLTATKVSDPKDAPLPDVNEDDPLKVTLTPFEGEAVTLTIYPTDSPSAKTAKAIVSNRQAVFDLPIETHDKLLPGLAAIPFDLTRLRSKQIANIDRKSIKAISIRPHTGFPVIIRYTEADTNAQTHASWGYSAEGSNHSDINEEQLYRLLKTITTAHVKAFPSDAPTDLATYGLDDPQLSIGISYKGKKPTMLLLSKGVDKSWYAMEFGKPSIYQIDNTFLKAFPTDSLSWKPKKLLAFSRFDLRQIWMERTGKSPLILSYNHLYDTWTAQQNGKDETKNINPNRANRYLASLEKMKVRTWLPYSDIEPAEALKNPIFRLKLVLEIAEEQPEEIAVNTPEAPSPDMIAPPEEKTYQKEIILEIAPAGEPGTCPYYFGKVNDSADFFILSMDEVRILGASVFEQQ
ncbi:MAG: DUF4340 domain-containing protein [Akkermansia sp.]